MEPKVTFVIANYNYGNYLNDAIKSAVSQKYPKNLLRVNFVDDCSTDNSVDVLMQNFISKSDYHQEQKDLYENCVVHNCVYNGVELNIFLSKKNRKQATSRNIAINYSLKDTDFFAILDADDINYDTKVARCLNELKNCPPNLVGAIYADYHTVNLDNQVMAYDFKKPYDKMVLDKECIVHSGSIISKHALLTVAENGVFFEPTMPPCEDYDMWMRIGEHFMILHIPEPLSLVRIHQNNCTHTYDNEFWRKQVGRVYERAYNRHANHKI